MQALYNLCSSGTDIEHLKPAYSRRADRKDLALPQQALTLNEGAQPGVVFGDRDVDFLSNHRTLRRFHICTEFYGRTYRGETVGYLDMEATICIGRLKQNGVIVTY